MQQTESPEAIQVTVFGNRSGPQSATWLWMLTVASLCFCSHPGGLVFQNCKTILPGVVWRVGLTMYHGKAGSSGT